MHAKLPWWPFSYTDKQSEKIVLLHNFLLSVIIISILFLIFLEFGWSLPIVETTCELCWKYYWIQRVPGTEACVRRCLGWYWIYPSVLWPWMFLYGFSQSVSLCLYRHHIEACHYLQDCFEKRERVRKKGGTNLLIWRNIFNYFTLTLKILFKING